MRGTQQIASQTKLSNRQENGDHHVYMCVSLSPLLILVFKEIQNRPDALRPESVGRVGNEDGVLVGTHLRSELALPVQPELLDDGVVGVLQQLDLGTGEVVTRY